MRRADSSSSEEEFELGETLGTNIEPFELTALLPQEGTASSALPDYERLLKQLERVCASPGGTFTISGEETMRLTDTGGITYNGEQIAAFGTLSELLPRDANGETVVGTSNHAMLEQLLATVRLAAQHQREMGMTSTRVVASQVADSKNGRMPSPGPAPLIADTPQTLGNGRDSSDILNIITGQLQAISSMSPRTDALTVNTDQSPLPSLAPSSGKPSPDSPSHTAVEVPGLTVQHPSALRLDRTNVSALNSMSSTNRVKKPSIPTEEDHLHQQQLRQVQQRTLRAAPRPQLKVVSSKKVSASSAPTASTN